VRASPKKNAPDQSGKDDARLAQRRDRSHRAQRHGPDDCGIGGERNDAAGRCLERFGVAQPNRHRAAQCQRGQRHGDAVEHANPRRIGQRTAGQARADAVVHCIARDRAAGGERGGDRRGRGLAPRACQADDPERHEGDADQREADEHFAGEHRCAQRHQQRRNAARDRVDLSEIAVVIGPHQEMAVAELQRRREGDIGPTCRVRQRQQRGDRDRGGGGGEAHHRHRPAPVASAAQHPGPRRVQHRGAEHEADHRWGHRQCPPASRGRADCRCRCMRPHPFLRRHDPDQVQGVVPSRDLSAIAGSPW
jgi:hypothetical protein